MGGNSKHLSIHVSFRPWTTNCLHRKGKRLEILFPQCSLALPDQQMTLKIAQIISDAFNQPVLSLQNASTWDAPTTLRGAAPHSLQASKANM